MRVTIPIVIASCLLVAILAWLIGTRNKDFSKPPTPKELVAIAQDWEQDKPHIPSAQADNNTPSAKEQKSTPPLPAESASRKPVKLPPVNLQISPALSEFGILSDQGASLLIDLATHLEAEGYPQRALLAWERVIDTTEPTPGERQQAVLAIKRLKSSLPPWNPDPVNDISLTIHAGAALKEVKTLQRALDRTAALISEASGHILKVQTKTAIGKSRDMTVPQIPVAIWFSHRGKSSKDPLVETPPISFMADPAQEDLLTSRIAISAYSLIRTHLASKTSFTPLPELPTDTRINPHDMLNCHITRLMWREFVNSLTD